MSRVSHRFLRAAYYGACAIIAVLSLAPSAALPPVSIGDKAEHAIAYALLGLIGGVSARGGVLRTILALAAFGIALELLQTFSPGRAPDAIDALADIVGACIGAAAALAVRRTMPIAIDKFAGGATRCRPCIAGGDGAPTSGAPAASSSSSHSSSSHKRSTCVSN